jgi:beta-aspartyl-peptidase (threonine type)
MLHRVHPLIVLAACACLAACHSTSRTDAASPRWAIAIHAGAGCYSEGWTDAQHQAHLDGLSRALEAGRAQLAAGASALDTVELVVRILEDDPNFNAGRGAVMTERGEHELDAAIMDGSTMCCGAAAGLKSVKNPVSFARQVMDRTRHVLFVGPEADALAASWGLDIVPNSHFSTPEARESLEDELARRRAGAHEPATDCTRMSTVGCVALDASGRLAAATSTGGLTGKMPGRVGDVPIIGAGTFADSRVAVSCTGVGEEFIRHRVASSIAALVALDGRSLLAACNHLIFDVLRPGDGGLIAVSDTGDIAMVFSTGSMCRGAADSSGRFEVQIRDGNHR